MRRQTHVALACGFATLFAIIAVIVARGRWGVDLDVARWMAAHRDRVGVDFFESIAWLGSVVGLVPLGVACAVYLKLRRGWVPVMWLVVAMCGATAVYACIMLLFHSERPPLELRAMDEIGYSFPSGHSTQAVTFWIFAPMLVGADRSVAVRRVLRGIGGALLGLTALSRIYLGVHWTFDVLGGLSLGACWTCCVFAMRAGKG